MPIEEIARKYFTSTSEIIGFTEEGMIQHYKNISRNQKERDTVKAWNFLKKLSNDSRNSQYILYFGDLCITLEDFGEVMN